MSYVLNCSIIVGRFMNDTDDVIHYNYVAWIIGLGALSGCVSCSEGVRTLAFLSTSTCIPFWY